MMKNLIARCALAAVLVVGVLAACDIAATSEAASASRPGTVAIRATLMGLGDSITAGAGASNECRAILASNHPDLTQVGSLSKNGYNHEGHSGFTSADIVANVSTYYNANKADIVFLHIGTNDPITGGLTPSQTATNVATICTTIHGINASAKIIVAAPIINSTSPNDIYNPDYTAAGAAIRTAVSGMSYVYPVSMPSNAPAGAFSDGVHPNDSPGYDTWFCPPLHRQLVDMGYLTVGPTNDNHVGYAFAEAR